MGAFGGALGGVGAAAAKAAAGVASSVGGQVAGLGAGAVLGSISNWVAAAAQWALGQLGGFLSSTTRPDLSARWFTSHFEVMAGVAAFVVVPMLLVSVMQAIARQDPAPMVRAGLVYLPLALLLTAVSVELVQLGLAAVDALCSTVAAGSGHDTERFLSGVATAVGGSAVSGQPGVPAFVTLVGSLVVLMGAFAVYLELIVRTAAIYLAVLFLPLALAGLVWPATAHWSKRLGETIAALLLSKLVIVTALSLAAAALGSGSRGGFRDLLTGAALLLLSAFSPFALLRLIPAVEAGAVAHLEGASRRTLQSLHLPSASTVVSLVPELGAGAALVGEAAGEGISLARGIAYPPWEPSAEGPGAGGPPEGPEGDGPRGGGEGGDGGGLAAGFGEPLGAPGRPGAPLPPADEAGSGLGEGHPGGAGPAASPGHPLAQLPPPPARDQGEAVRRPLPRGDTGG